METILSYCTFVMLLFVSAAESVPFNVTRLTDRILVLTQAPWEETMTVIDAGPCLVVLETWGSLDAAKKASHYIDSLLHKPVRYVINSHHHWDHTFGNAAFPNAEIIGHQFCTEDMRADYGTAKARKAYFAKNARQTSQSSLRDYISDVGRQAADPAFKLAPPTLLTGERDTLTVGDLHFILYHTPGIHTRSFITIFIPELGIVFGRTEYLDPTKMKLEPGADPAIIQRVLADIQAAGKPLRFLIPGHGDAVENPIFYP